MGPDTGLTGLAGHRSEESKEHTREPASLDAQAWAVHLIAWPGAEDRGMGETKARLPERSLGGHPVNT